MITLEKHVSLLAFDDRPLHAKAFAVYEGIFSEYSGKDEHFKSFGNMKELFVTLSEAINNSDTLVLAIAQEHYLQVKKLLFTALRTQTGISDEILSRMGEDASEEDETFAVMPESAEILLSSDGRYSGFIERRGAQTLFFLPLDDVCAAEIEAGLRSALGALPVAAEHANATQQSGATEEPGIEDIEETSSAEHVNPYKVADLMRERGITAAVAPGKCSPFVFSVIPTDSDDDSYDDVIFPADVELQKGEMSHKEYIAALAGQARLESGAALGVSLSNVFLSPDSSDEYFMFFCVADEHNARLFKIYSREGETSQEFIYACVHRLYEVLTEYAEHCGFVYQDPYDPSVITLHAGGAEEEAVGRTGKKTAVIITLVAILAILLGIAVTFIVKAYNGGKKNDDVSDSSGTSEQTGLLDVFEDFIFADVEDESSTSAEASSDGLSAESTSSVSELMSITDISTLLSTAATTAISTLPSDTTVAPPSSGGSETEAPTQTENSSGKTGTFTFTVYGYGHGVGMSQQGAKAYANSGWSYSRILLHYYNSSEMQILYDVDMPATVSYNGTSYPLVEYLAKATRAEMGSSAPAEAFKAQVVAIYTYAKRTGFNMTSSHHAFNSSYDYEGTAIHSAVKAVLGRYLAYRGSPAFTPYFSTSAGKTTSCQNAWGGGSYPYLQGGRTSPEGDVVRTLTISSEEIRAKVNEYNSKVDASSKITLHDDPAEWIQIISHDSAVSSSIGYISSLRIGDQTMRGNQFRLNIMGASTLRSHCFTYKYTPD